MDLIRAYACGLLPDNHMQDPDEVQAIRMEVYKYMPEMTTFRFKTLMEQSSKIISYMDAVGDWDIMGIISMQKLCGHLLKEYEQQGKKI